MDETEDTLREKGKGGYSNPIAVTARTGTAPHISRIDDDKAWVATSAMFRQDRRYDTGALVPHPRQTSSVLARQDATLSFFHTRNINAIWPNLPSLCPASSTAVGEEQMRSIFHQNERYPRVCEAAKLGFTGDPVKFSLVRTTNGR